MIDPELRRWKRNLPVSPMIYPTTWPQRLKYYLWSILRPVHPYVRNLLAFVGYMKKYEKYRPNGRQRFLLGTIAPGKTVQMVGDALVKQGYGNHFIALKDQGEVVSLRYTPDFEHQYHVRIFTDGEVRAHYEFSVECHPFMHDREIGFEERREEFMKVLSDLIVPSTI